MNGWETITDGAVDMIKNMGLVPKDFDGIFIEDRRVEKILVF